MVLYNCKQCFKEFKQKSNYMSHLNRKNPCKKRSTEIAPSSTEIAPSSTEIELSSTEIELSSTEIAPSSTEIELSSTEIELSSTEISLSSTEITSNNNINNHICIYCSISVTRHSSLIRHIKYNCKLKKQDDNYKETIYQKLLNEHLNIKNKLTELENKLLKDNITNNNINTINNNAKNINNGTINNIQIIAHGKEDLSKIKEDVVLQLVKRGWRSVPMFTEYLHCNDKFPEQKNIYINDINRKYCMVYDGKEWILKDKTETIDNLYQTKYDFLEENFNTYYDQLEEYQQCSFKKFIKLHEEDEPFVRKIKEELKTLLYNKRNKILNK
jgi:hypothetical protein